MKNRDFRCENPPDRSKSRKLNTFFGHLPRADRQNLVQNRDFSENPLHSISQLRTPSNTPPRGDAILPTTSSGRFVPEAAKSTILLN